MNIEFLRKVLGDDLYSQVEAKLKDSKDIDIVNLATGDYISKNKYNDALKERDDKIKELTGQVQKYDGVDVEKLKKDVLDWENKYKEDMAKTKKDSALELAITTSKAKNNKLVRALLDDSIIKLDDNGKLVGFNEQLENIKKENSYLFTEEEKKDPENVNLGGNHSSKNDDTKPLTMDNALEDYYSKN